MRERRRSPTPARPVWLIPVLLAAWTVAAFHGILSHQFVGWDDSAYVYDNPHIQRLGSAELAWMFTSRDMGHYHPLTWLSLAVDCAMWGLNPRGFLATNLALHIASGVLLYFLWKQIRPFVADETPVSDWLGALAIALFLVHPLRVEAVAWISDRKELLASVFCLASLLAYVRARTHAEHAGRWMLISGGLFAASLLSKATAVGLPLVLLGLDVLLFKRLQRDSAGALCDSKGARSKAVSPWRLLGEKWLHFAAMGAMLVVAPFAQGNFGAAASLEQHPLTSRLAQAAYNLCFHPWKSLWPSDLCCLYPLHAPLDPLEPRFVLSAILVVAAVLAVGWFAARRRNYWPAFFLGSYLILVLPVSGLWQSGAQFVADRYSYFPAMLVALVTAGIPATWIAHALATSTSRWSFAGGTAALLVALVTTTARQADTWQNSETLWNRALDCDSQNSTAWNNLGHYHREQRDLKRSHACYARAVELDPQPMYLINLGSLEAATGNRAQAAEHYRAAIARDARFHEAHFNLANLLTREGAVADALPHYAEAWRLAPGVYAIGANYARALLISERFTESAEVYRAAIDLEPARSVGWEGLGGALLSAGEPAAAVEALEKASELKDATPHGALLLAKSYERRGDSAKAREVLAQATRRWPGESGPHREMAARLEQAERR